ncbi:MAG: nucleotidyltransferase family protein [Erysipelotrichaceae bacterium]
MNVTGIVVEYNPFHYGHIHHITQTKGISNCDVLIAVMSSNFVQRGEPAIINKWERTKFALSYGVDIIVELPFVYSTQSASEFATASINILKLLGVNSIVFGSECNSIHKLMNYVNTEQQIKFDPKLSTVKNYEAVNGGLGPNDILASCYLKAIRDSKIVPYTIQRTNAYHDDKLSSTLSSASAIRKAIANNEDISDATPMASLLSDANTIDKYYPLIRAKLLSSSPQDLKAIFMFDEGIENLFIKQAVKNYEFESFINSCISKRYTRAKIYRTLTHLINDTRKECINTLPVLSKVRVLGFNDIGRNYLATLDSSVYTTNINDYPEPYRSIELTATRMYTYPLAPTQQKEIEQLEFKGPIYHKK